MPITVEKIVHHLPLLCTRFIDSPKAFPDCLQRKANNHKSFSTMIIFPERNLYFFPLLGKYEKGIKHEEKEV